MARSSRSSARSVARVWAHRAVRPPSEGLVGDGRCSISKHGQVPDEQTIQTGGVWRLLGVNGLEKIKQLRACLIDRKRPGEHPQPTDACLGGLAREQLGGRP